MKQPQPETAVIQPGQLRKVKITFAVIYFFFMLTRAVFGPFVSVYLQEKGLTEAQIGVITAVNSFAIIVTQPLWGLIADRIQSRKKTLIICMWCQAAFALLLVFVNTYLSLAVVFCIYTSFSSSEGPLMDTWTLSSLKKAGDPNGMGPVKMWGCIGFSLASVVSGIFISRYSTGAIIPIFSALLFLIGIFLMLIRDEGGTTPTSFKEMQLGRIFRDKPFIIFLVYVFFMQLAHRGSYTFVSLLIKNLGGGNDLVGVSSALMFVSEAVVMFLSKKMLGKMKPEILVMLSSLFFALWHLLLSLSTQPIHAVLSCLMDGPSFALFTVGCLYYMDKIAPPEIHTTYQTVAYSVYFGLSGIVGNMGAGWLIEHLGYRPMYWIGIAITLTSTAVFFWVRQKESAGKTESR